VKKILSFEMKKNKSVYKYIDQFNKLRTEYESLLKIDKDKKKITASSAVPASNDRAPTPSATPIPAEEQNQTSLIDISEINFIKYFIAGSRSRTHRRQLRSENHGTLKDAQTSLKDTCEEEEDLVDDSEDDNSDSEDDSDADTSDFESEEVYYNTTPKKVNKARKNAPSTVQTDLELKELVNNMSLMMGEFVKSTQNNARSSNDTSRSNNFALQLPRKNSSSKRLYKPLQTVQGFRSPTLPVFYVQEETTTVVCYGSRIADD
jgi:hypothetical protein